MIKQDTIERIRAETEIVELVGNYLPLKKVGRNYRGVCPFHPDRSPSFYVSPERQTYHCFGCGAGGNAINFIMEYEKLAFPEAVRFLAGRLGIEVAEERSDRHRGVYDACERAAQFYERQLRRNDTALRYLVRRGIAPDVVKLYRLGYAPGGTRLRDEIRRRSLPLEDFRQAGLIADRGSGAVDYFYNRIMFPILSPGGKVIGFGGRVLDDTEPKYLNSPETAVFRKGDGLYGLFQAKGHLRETPALLVEGNFDLLALAGSGFGNAVAPLGTALTPGQALLLRRYTGSVIVCFDGDEAGLRAARRSLEPLLRAGLEPMVARLPSGSDPDDIIRTGGREQLAALLDNAVDFVEFVTGGRIPADVAGQRRMLADLAGLLKVIPDPTAQELYANRVAALFRVEKRGLLEPAREPRGPTRPRVPAAGFEERLVAALVQDAELARIAAELELAEMIETEELRLVVRTAAELRGEPDYGPALLLDRFEDPALRRRVAGWTFARATVPSAAEFRARVQRIRAAKLQKEIIANCEREDDEQAERLVKERTSLLRRAAHGGTDDEQ